MDYKKITCADYKQRYDELLALRDQYLLINKDLKHYDDALKLQKKINDMSELVEIGLYKRVPISQWFLAEGAALIGHDEVTLLRDEVAIDWLYLKPLYREYWFGLGEKNGKYYLVYDKNGAGITYEKFGNTGFVTVSEKFEWKDWLDKVSAYEFKTKESAIMFIWHSLKIFTGSEKLDVLERLDPEAASDYKYELMGPDDYDTSEE